MLLLKRLDVARLLIQTSSWKMVNKLIVICINGLIFTIRLVEEPFLDSKCIGGRQSICISISSIDTKSELFLSHFSINGGGALGG